MNLNMKLTKKQQKRVIEALAYKEPEACNYILLSQDKMGNVSINHNVEEPHGFILLFKYLLSAGFVSDLSKDLPEEVISEAMKELHKHDMDDLDMDNPAVLPSQVLGDVDED